MIVQCPSCQSKFRLPDDKIGPAGSKLRCGKCRHVFHVDPPTPPDLSDFDYPDDMAPIPERPAEESAAPPPPPPPPPPAKDEHFEADSRLDDDLDDLFGAAPKGADKNAPRGRGRENEDENEDSGQPLVSPGFSLDDVADIAVGGKAVKSDPAKRKRLILIGAILGGIAVCVLAAVFFLGLWPGGEKKPAPEAPAEKAPAEAPAAPKADEAAKVKDIVLQNVRQYYVNNEKTGQIFVIEGKAVNNFKTPKEMIKLEASLYDEKGASLASKEVLCGNTVSLFQLQVMTKEELDGALSSQVGILTNNTNIATGGETPFMILFFNPPEALKEFGVRVIDAKDPPGK